MRVKSGPPRFDVATAPGSRCASAAGGGSDRDRAAALESVTLRTRPPTRSPTRKPTRRLTRTKRRTMWLRHVDLARGPVAGFRDRDGEDAVLEIRGDPVDVNRLGQREGAREMAVSAFDAVVLLARDVVARAARASRSGGARAAHPDTAGLRVNLDMI